MPDVQQTLMGLSILATGYQGFPEAEKVLWDAIELLRRMEPVKPKKYISIVNRTEYLCGACDCGILYGDEHCRHCGRQVKWDT